MKVKRIVCSVILTSLALLLGFATIFTVLNAINQTPKVRVQNRMADCEGLTLSYLSDFIEDRWLSDVSFSADLEQTEVKGQNITLTLVNECYFDVFGLNLNGDSFTESDIESKSHKVIISDKLALKLFFNSNAVGKSVYIDGERFIVSGIYNEPDDMLSRCSSDGKDRIFLPYTLSENEVYADTIIYKNNSSNAILNQLCSYNYNCTNLSQKMSVIYNFISIVKIIIFIILSIVIIRLIIRLSKQLLARIKEELGYKYFHIILRDNLPYILIRAIPILALIAMPVLLLIFGNLNIYVIPDYMPKDNFFDVQFYISKIIETAQDSNAISLLGNQYYSHLYTTTFTACSYLVTLFALTSILAYRSIKKLFMQL